jgi:hypothetical protein
LGSDSKVWNFTFDACSLSVMHPYRAEAERMRREEEKRRLEEAARKAEYERSAKAVKALAQQWQESKLLRAFTAALQSTATEAQLSGETKQRLQNHDRLERKARRLRRSTHRPQMDAGEQFKNPPWHFGD